MWIVPCQTQTISYHILQIIVILKRGNNNILVLRPVKGKYLPYRKWRYKCHDSTSFIWQDKLAIWLVNIWTNLKKNILLMKQIIRVIRSTNYNLKCFGRMLLSAFQLIQASIPRFQHKFTIQYNQYGWMFVYFIKTNIRTILKLARPCWQKILRPNESKIF